MLIQSEVATKLAGFHREGERGRALFSRAGYEQRDWKEEREWG